MGWCHEFGPQISETCEHPMTAGRDHCSCSVCGTVCTGRFAGCGSVWAAGPRGVRPDAPHLGHVSLYEQTYVPEPAPVALAADDPNRWRLPLDPPPPLANEPAVTANDNYFDPAYVASAEPQPGSPDVAARYAVTQLEQLNERVTRLTEWAIERTDESMAKVYDEISRMKSMREVDLTEQAAGIFGAVTAGTEALQTFSRVVAGVTDDLKAILTESLKAIGGTDGLAAWVAASASDLAETREEFATSLGKIERDLTLLRRRSQTTDNRPIITDDQLTFIVEAVTESVVDAFSNQGKKRR